MLIYQYDVAGVSYEARRTLPIFGNGSIYIVPARPATSVRYDARNLEIHGDCRSWMGLRQ